MGLFSRKKEQKPKEQGVLTLYSVTLNTKAVYERAVEQFGTDVKTVNKRSDGIDIILKDDLKLEISMNDEAGFISQQTNGMANFFSQAPLENKKVLEQAIIQIRLFTCITGVKFELSEDKNRNDAILEAIYQIAEQTQSLILYPSMELYTAKGDLLISIAGETDLEHYYPIANSSLLKSGMEASPKDEERFQQIIKHCDEEGIPHPSYRIGTQMLEQEVVVPPVEEIAKRAAAVFSCALFSECLLVEDGSLEMAQNLFAEVNKVYGVRGYLSEREREYVEMEPPEQPVAIQFSWQYERVAILLWALGLMEYSDPTGICNVGEVAGILKNYGSLEELIQASRVKSSEELLEAHTRILYYDWACVDARIKNQQAPAGLVGGVVQEQHYVMNWLVGANGDCDWDDIRPNT
jgi:hypothetical protein